MDFYTALKECFIGKKICRQAWIDEDPRDCHLFVKEGRLSIQTREGKVLDLIVTDADASATDWKTL